MFETLGSYAFWLDNREGEPTWVQIDKAFLIARPMRKGSWTRRFAAGWGELGAGYARGELVEIGYWESAGGFCEKSLTMRAQFRTRDLLV